VDSRVIIETVTMNPTQFYMTLPSTSSSKLFPENTTANYITHLYKNVELRGAWEVAVTEFHFPHTFFNVNKGSNKVKAQRSMPLAAVSKDRTVKQLKAHNHLNKAEGAKIGVVNPGYYKNDADFLTAVNQVFFTMELGEIRINPNTHGGHFFPYLNPSENDFESELKRDEVETPMFITLGEVLSRQLGYEPGVNISAEPIAKMPLNLSYGLPSHIYIYSDIVESSMVGDTHVPLLKMINPQHSKYKYGEEATVIIHTPQYMPIAKYQFDTIQIDLREQKGHNVPFTYGSSAIVLHFRRSPTA
jgi:hypothetical protein